MQFRDENSNRGAGRLSKKEGESTQNEKDSSKEKRADKLAGRLRYVQHPAVNWARLTMRLAAS